ncbi:extracellular solute-binding protein [Metabacillus halosaccharovorans]|uniref:extracellular solute-binding protein n=1 Tax=Metabacillus halosaccharovorans TaxID=930124 RepID=UPI001C1FD6BE|nr:extracellular solute-binding protein [Metabacillus halosaccharovorans]MBU7595734.1 extracellular solute-binding protein [Metabacillus halosaccharovorans]
MRYSIKKWSIAILMAVATVLSGCALEEAAEPDKSLEKPDDPMEKYKPPIDVSVDFTIGDPIADGFKEEEWANNAWNQYYRDELGINLNAKWFCKGEMCRQKKSIAIASGDIPDITGVSQEELSTLSKTNLIRTDMKELYDLYASDLTKQIMNEAGDEPWESATFDGKVMAIPSVDSSIDVASFLWVRQDWLDKLGLEVPKTMDELYTVMKAFKEQDPDGNGKDDTYGLMLQKDFLVPGVAESVGLMNGFHAYPRMWVEDESGKLVYGSAQPEMKKALTFLSKLYEEGMIEQDFGAKTSDKAAELAASGKVGVNFGAMWNGMFPFQQTKDNFPESDWRAYTLVSADNKPARPQIELRVTGYNVVKKDFDHPEALVKLLNAWSEAYTGTDKALYDKLINEAKGAPGHHLASFKTWPAKKNLNAHLNVTKALESKDTTGLTAEELSYYENILKYQEGDNTMAQYEKVFGKTGSFSAMKEYEDKGLFMMDQFFGASTDTMKSRMDTIKKKELEYFTKVIMGSASVNEFDQFTEELNTLGLADITEEINDWKESNQ